MAVDGCAHSFQELVAEVLPQYMERMRKAMDRPYPMRVFAEPGVTHKKLLGRFGLEEDLPGCYVLLESGSPMYVGISGNVLADLLRQAKSRTPFHGSLAYRMAWKTYGTEPGERPPADDEGFTEEFENAKKFLQMLDIAFIEIRNPLELRLFQVFCAMTFDTGEWNTFRVL